MSPSLSNLNFWNLHPTPIPPKYKEGMIITLVDKLNSSRELPTISYFAKTASSKLKFKPKLEKEYNKD